MKKNFKRFLAALLTAVMVLNVGPASVIVNALVDGVKAQAAETVLDAAIFCSDVHGSSSDLTSVLGGVKTSGVDYSSIGFVGDTCLTVANTTSTVQSALGDTDIEVMFSYAASHDTENSADISTKWDYSGEVEKVSDYYLVYTIRETDMQNNNTAEADFTTWYNGLTETEKKLPIFIMSHRPLHARRNDNANAADWYDVISAAAETSDIVFFWGHNHTGESNVDTAAYYVAKDGDETITVYIGDTVTPNFTYMNAGYINANNQDPARIGVATTVKITADSLIFQDYNSSGEYTGNYAHNVTVGREFAAEEDEVTLSSIAVSGTTEYTVGDELALTVTATYDDGTTADVTADATFEPAELTASGTYTVTASYGEMTDTIDVTVNLYDEVLAADGESLLLGVEALSQGATALEVTWDDDAEAILDAKGLYTDYVVYDLALTNPGETTKYAMTLVDSMDTTNLAVYHVADDGTLTLVPCTIENDCVVFTTALTGTFAYGAITVPEGYTLSSVTLEGIPTDMFVGGSLDLTDAVITATYTKEGAEDFVRQLTVYDYDETNFSGYDVNVVGAQTAVFTFDGVTAELPIHVWDEEFTKNNVTVHVGEGEYGVTDSNVAESTNTYVADAVADVMKSGYVAYDITLTYAEDYTANDAAKTVTLPIPEGVTNPVVYYVSDDGKTVTNMNATVSGSNVVFTTTHFSTYVVGESTEITVPDPTTQTVTGATTTEKKTVYVLVDSIEAGEKYLIVSNNYALLNNSGSASSVSVTDNGEITIDGTTYDGYIELDNSNAVWTAVSGYTFKNGTYYLGYSTSSSGGGGGGGTSYSVALSTSTSRNWTYSDNYLYVTTSSSANRYIYYGSSGWSLSRNTSGGGSSSSRNVYLYKEVTYDEVTSANGTYSIAGNPAEVSKVVVEGTTTTLGSTLTFVPESGTTTTTDTSAAATYTVVNGGDPNGIISGISGNTVTFTGNYGKALVKVSYTVTVKGTDYTVDNYITVTATAPIYDIEISQDGTTAANDIIAVRGVTENQTLELSYILTYEDADGVQTLTPDSGITWYCYLADGSAASAIASIDQTGKLTFTGAEGTIKVMVAYETSAGATVNDIITINVRKSTAVTPNESTSDFPRWPNEGAVRFDKTATAVGNFSETGIAQVELSMAGIPVKTGGAVDVVIMLDMTGSMSTTAMTAAEESAIAFAEQIVKNDDGTYNDSRIAVLAFNSGSSSPYTYWELGTITADQWDSFCTAVRGASEDQVSGGTPYDEALGKCQTVLANAKTDGTGNDRQQFCVFVSDGGPTSYEYITNYDAVKAGTATSYTTSTASATGGSNQSDSNFATIATYTHEYYSTLMKDAGVTMYSVLTGLSADDYPNCTTILQNIASDSSKAYVVEDGSDTTALTNAFTAIAEEINAAATNVEVEDVITDEYDMIFELPNSNIKGLPDGQEFYIEVVDYPLDETTHERTGESTIKQRIYLATNTDGEVYISKITYTDDSGNVVEQAITPVYTEKASETEKAYFDASGNYYPEGNGTHHMTSGAYVVLNDDGSLKSLHTVYFTYVVASKQLNWTVTSMSQTSETALRYFVYLKNSGGVDAANQVDAGTYPTNKYASLTYTNHLGNECEQTFPVPQMTWNGAQVSYVFYLVNENGVPVNRAGREITFAEAIFVTDIYTYAIIWNDLEQAAGLEAEYLANGLLPSDYRLYDTNAFYKIHVYEDEEGVNLNNHFIIGGTNGDTTTYVYNNKTDVTKYNTHGTYAATTTYLCKSYNVTATVENGVVTAATYASVEGETQVLASAMESTTGASIVDGYAYYVDENNKVYTIVQKKDATETSGFDFANTTVAFAVVWGKKLVEDTVVVDFGLPVDIDVVSNDFVYNYISGIGAKDPNYGINTGYKTDAGALTAKELTVNGHYVMIYDQNHIRFTPGSGTSMEFNEPVEFYYETTVEVYENSQVVPSYMYSKVTVIPATTVYYEDSFLTLTTTDRDGNIIDSAWTTEGTVVNATQDQDRPGASKISEALDADNNYGYDSAYAEMSMHSLGSAAKITVDSSKRGEATFTFYGTGFDVISTTSNKTGTLIVQVFSGASATGTAVKSLVVDTYYGMEADGTLSINDPEVLYQVPVMKVTGLDYAQYTVKIIAAYNDYFDHTETEGSYDLYLDAVRIYDPTGNLNETANNAYKEDGEGWPVYEELRNNVISAEGVTTTTDADGNVTVNFPDDATLSKGAIFIDSNDSSNDIAEYVSYGPNNELYLADGQAIAFNVTVSDIVADVQLGIKLGNGASVTYTINGDEYTTSSTTDLYYSILPYAKAGTVVIKNMSDGILSLTNIKVTYTSDPYGVSTSSLMWMDDVSAGFALMSLRAPVVEDVEPEMEETEVETTETEEEETEAETTETEEEETEAETTESEEEETEAETTESEEEETEEETTESEAEETETETAEYETEETEEESDGILGFFSNIMKSITNTINKLFGRWFR